LQVQCAGDVVGVDVGVERQRQRQAELLHFGQVAVDAVDHRVDEQRLPVARSRAGRCRCSTGARRVGGRSWWLGVGLLLMGAAVSVISALQFRAVLRGLGEKEIPRGYWTNLGVWLNFLLAFVALALAIHFVTSSGA
jgi:hypothetical protein